MASGRTHLAVESGAGALLTGTLAFEPVRIFLIDGTGTPLLLAFGLGYVFSMLFLSPDLDLDQCAARRRWGPLGFVWGLYPRLFSHRGLSHDLLAGTLTRLVYLIGVLGIVTVPLFLMALHRGVVDPADIDPEAILSRWRLAAGFVAGCYVPNVLHVLVDRMTPSRA